MTRLPYRLDHEVWQRPIGMIVLRADETLEQELPFFLTGPECALYVSRINSPSAVTRDALIAMETDLTRSSALLPDIDFSAVAYACTSASALIGSETVERLIRSGCRTAAVTDPIRAATARAITLGINRFALVSPYIDEVNQPLIAAFARSGIEISSFGSFGVAEEHDVVRIANDSVVDAAIRLGSSPEIEAVFLSCTNLRTREAIPEIEEAIGKPALSSNSVLAWHLQDLVQKPVTYPK